MARRLELPLFGDLLQKKQAAPTLENARKRLGGKAERNAQTGAVVRLIDEVRETPSVGIVLYGNEHELEVLVARQLLRKTKPELTLPADVESVDAAMLAEVRVFG